MVALKESQLLTGDAKALSAALACHCTATVAFLWCGHTLTQWSNCACWLVLGPGTNGWRFLGSGFVASFVPIEVEAL